MGILPYYFITAKLAKIAYPTKTTLFLFIILGKLLYYCLKIIRKKQKVIKKRNQLNLNKKLGGHKVILGHLKSAYKIEEYYL